MCQRLGLFFFGTRGTASVAPFYWTAGTDGFKRHVWGASRPPPRLLTHAFACLCGRTAQGFLPAEVDVFVQDVLYPSFSPQMLLFLGMSSAYGLWKTGKLPGQQQIK